MFPQGTCQVVTYLHPVINKDTRSNIDEVSLTNQRCFDLVKLGFNYYPTSDQLPSTIIRKPKGHEPVQLVKRQEQIALLHP